MHLCINCRYFNAGWSTHDVPESQCLAPGNLQPDYVNGGTVNIVFSAQSCRANRTLCTPQAIWYEEKERKAAMMAM